jgi:hypothetical protein
MIILSPPSRRARLAQRDVAPHFSFVITDRALHDHRIPHVIQGQMPAKIGHVAGKRLERHHAASGSHKD